MTFLCGICMFSPYLWKLSLSSLPAVIQRHPWGQVNWCECENMQRCDVSIYQPCDSLATCPRLCTLPLTKYPTTLNWISEGNDGWMFILGNCSTFRTLPKSPMFPEESNKVLAWKRRLGRTERQQTQLINYSLIHPKHSIQVIRSFSHVYNACRLFFLQHL